MKLFVVFFVLSVAVTALAGYSGSNAKPRYAYIVANSRPVSSTFNPYYVTSTQFKPVYTAKPMYVYDNGYGYGYGQDYGYGYGSSFRPIWSSSNQNAYNTYYGYAGSYGYNPYYLRQL
ncbi:hypothetical protein CEXT_400221 [Caerostris extrusa]|uniref:Uncharacterized protein n=1 Tax=Caerostris extrusa TaxID=172846 RepID=A0AAV4VWC8_CAEEX|nr:hypothetical protein CEXT_400221 [Caerostris extrusa]